MIVPWRDRHGRFLPLKAVVLAAGFIPGLVLAFWWASGRLGGRPVTEVIHGTGDWAIRYILIALAITPAVRILHWPRLLLVRRIVGLTALAYVLAHLTLYAVDVNLRLGFVVSEIIHRCWASPRSALPQPTAGCGASARGGSDSTAEFTSSP
jgi:methionine sulfoxide reductase heme-binding subunit